MASPMLRSEVRFQDFFFNSLKNSLKIKPARKIKPFMIKKYLRAKKHRAESENTASVSLKGVDSHANRHGASAEQWSIGFHPRPQKCTSTDLHLDIGRVELANAVSTK